jgi:hypothetical protein
MINKSVSRDASTSTDSITLRELQQMYLQNKYTTWYYNIVKSAKTRNLSKISYKEKHHILPRSLGGTDEKNNIVKLTAREHFICHLLLTKMTVGNAQQKMIYALWCMSMLTTTQKQYKIKSHIYSKMREQFKKLQSNRYSGEGNPNFGKTHGAETRDKIKRARAEQDNTHLKGRIINEEWREKLRIASVNNPNKHDPKPKGICKKCGGSYARHILKRWHDENCKTINNTL